LRAGLYLVLGFFVFYIMWLRNTSALTVFEKDPCRSRRQNFQQNGTLSEVSRDAEYRLILQRWAAKLVARLLSKAALLVKTLQK
jgi:hypothetical protein